MRSIQLLVYIYELYVYVIEYNQIGFSMCEILSDVTSTTGQTMIHGNDSNNEQYATSNIGDGG